MSVYYPAEALDGELENPEFHRAGKVHDWRNYVGEETQKLWKSFTPEQRRAIAMDADEMASTEHWD